MAFTLVKMKKHSIKFYLIFNLCQHHVLGMVICLIGRSEILDTDIDVDIHIKCNTLSHMKSLQRQNLFSPSRVGL